jgi:hypothetical protein
MTDSERQKALVTSIEEGLALVVEGDRATLARRVGDKLGRQPNKVEKHRARERLVKLGKGRVPVRLEVAGDPSNPTPVPFRYVDVVPSGEQGRE